MTQASKRAVAVLSSTGFFFFLGHVFNVIASKTASKLAFWWIIRPIKMLKSGLWPLFELSTLNLSSLLANSYHSFFSRDFCIKESIQ
jgi:hypothetical protein